MDGAQVPAGLCVRQKMAVCPREDPNRDGGCIGFDAPRVPTRPKKNWNWRALACSADLSIESKRDLPVTTTASIQALAAR
jgi:hypothetical protein